VSQSSKFQTLVSARIAVNQSARHNRIRLTVVIAAAVTVISWSFSSPPLATPDERVHIPSIWCAQSALRETCLDREFDKSSGVTSGRPGYLPTHCYFRQTYLSANCTEEDSYSRSVRVLREGTYYLPGFQVILNFLISDNGVNSIFRIRMVNGLLFALLLVVVVLAAPVRLARSVVAAIAMTMTPFALWLISSPNPSSWAITGVVGVWVAATWCISDIRPHSQGNFRARLQFPIALGIGSGLLAGTSRLDALVMGFTVLVLVVANEFAGTLSRRVRLVLASAAAPAAAIAAFLLSSEITERRESLGPLSPADLSKQPDFWVWLTNWSTHFPAVFLDAYGVQGLGENDVRIPAIVLVVSLLVLGAAISFAADRIVMQQLVSIGLTALAFLCMLWFASFEMDLYNVPGRYVMPLFPVIVGTYIYYSRSEVQFFDVLRLRHIAIGMLGIANALSLYAVVERYSAGSSAGLRVIPVRFDEWWWDFLPIGPNGVVVLGSVSWVVFLVYAFRFLDQRKLQEANA